MGVVAMAFLVLLAAGTVESEVRARVEVFAEAFRSGDVQTVETLLAERYSHCNSDGSCPTRKQWLDWFRERSEDVRAGRYVLTEYRNEELRVQVHGTVAVITAINVSAGTRDGAPFRTRLRFTQVWALEGGEWRRIAFHDSRLPAEE